MKKLVRSLILPLTAIGIACSQPGDTPASPTTPTSATNAQAGGLATPLSATMDFGIDTIGSPFPPPSGHDQSSHAKDNIVPRTVVIDPGGTVTFRMGPAALHQVAIYEPGTEPTDIDTSILLPPPATCPPVPLINDPNNRVAFLSTQVCAGGSAAPTYTFTEPGRYLVICAVLPHFNVGMYGWVIVRDR